MDHRIAALEKAEQVAARTNVLRTGLRAASKASGVTTSVSTVWSLAVRFGFLINAVVTAVVDDGDDSCL